MKIYINTDFKCHTTNYDGTLREFDVKFFNGKCQTFIDGYRFIPDGEVWKRGDGVIFTGEMIAPWKDFSELDMAQREYEEQQLNMLYEYINKETELNTSYEDGINSI